MPHSSGIFRWGFTLTLAACQTEASKWRMQERLSKNHDPKVPFTTVGDLSSDLLSNPDIAKFRKVDLNAFLFEGLTHSNRKNGVDHPATDQAWSARSAASAGSLAAPCSAASSVPSHPDRPNSLATADSGPHTNLTPYRPHLSPPGTSLRCSLKHAIKATAHETKFRRWATLLRCKAPLMQRTVA